MITISCQKSDDKDKPKSRQDTVPEAKYVDHKGEKIPLPAAPLEQELLPISALVPPQVQNPFTLQLETVCKGIKKAGTGNGLPEKMKESCLGFEKNQEGLTKLNSYIKGIEATGDSVNKQLCLEIYCNK